MIAPDNPMPASDRRAFENWFLEAYPLPKTKAQQGMWKAKQRIAWTGWDAARRIPKPPLDKSLTKFEFSPLTPEDVEKFGRAEERIICDNPFSGPAPTEYPAPECSYQSNRGLVHIVGLPRRSTRTAMQALAGQTILLDGSPLKVRGVETHCVEQLHAGDPIGFLGDYVTHQTPPAPTAS